MKLRKLTAATEIKKGDLLIIKNKDSIVNPYFVREVKQVHGETEVEVILNKRKNTWFSLRMYLLGESWVKDARVVTA